MSAPIVPKAEGIEMTNRYVTMTLTKLASNMVTRMIKIDAFADPDAYSYLWDAILDEFKAAGVDLAPMICAAWTKGNNP
jgi:hypothetical protein